jgi:hypothetical protein
VRRRRWPAWSNDLAGHAFESPCRSLIGAAHGGVHSARRATGGVAVLRSGLEGHFQTRHAHEVVGERVPEQHRMGLGQPAHIELVQAAASQLRVGALHRRSALAVQGLSFGAHPARAPLRQMRAVGGLGRERVDVRIAAFRRRQHRLCTSSRDVLYRLQLGEAAVGQPVLGRVAVALGDLGVHRHHLDGLRFAGRLSENFKLSNGSWVSTGDLRLALIEACQPMVTDVVIAAPERNDIRLLVWVHPAERLHAGASVEGELPPAAYAAIGARLSDRLRAHNLAACGGTYRVGAFRILHSPASIGAGETTDKGYVNQRGVLACRAALVAELYSADAGSEVIRLWNLHCPTAQTPPAYRLNSISNCSMEKVKFFFDFGSPNAYVCHRVIPAIESRTGAEFEYVPVLLGGIFKLTGNQSGSICEIGSAKAASRGAVGVICWESCPCGLRGAWARRGLVLATPTFGAPAAQQPRAHPPRLALESAEPQRRLYGASFRRSTVGLGSMAGLRRLELAASYLPVATGSPYN